MKRELVFALIIVILVSCSPAQKTREETPTLIAPIATITYVPNRPGITPTPTTSIQMPNSLVALPTPIHSLGSLGDPYSILRQGRELYGAIIYDWRDFDEKVKNVAKTYDILVLNEWVTDAYVYALKQENPNLVVLMYKHIGCNDKDEYLSSCDYRTANQHDDWFMQRDGIRYEDKFNAGQDWHTYYMDISKEEVREYQAEHLKFALTERSSSFDGVFLDIALHDGHYLREGHSSGMLPESMPDDASVRDVYRELLSLVKLKLNAEGKMLIPNFDTLTGKEYWLDLVIQTDGAYEENFQGSETELEDMRMTVTDDGDYVGRLYLAGLNPQVKFEQLNLPGLGTYARERVVIFPPAAMNVGYTWDTAIQNVPWVNENKDK